jgi:hypothetical protein
MNLPRRPTSWLFAAVVLAAAGGCGTLRENTEPPEAPKAPDKPETVAPLPFAAPGKYANRVSQYVFYSDMELKPDHELFTELGELRDQVHRELQLPTANTVVQVFLFEDEDRYKRYMKLRYPELPPRRAFFIAQPRSAGGADELLVYTYWGEHIRQDLRHELTHALLHSVLRDVPLWLDEGIAEYFELPPERMGVNAQHLEQLRRGPFQPDLGRLEGLTKVVQMKPPEYRESWAWVHLMLDGPPEARKVLLKYLQALRGTEPAAKLLPQLKEAIASPDDALAAHLTAMEQSVRR